MVPDHIKRVTVSGRTYLYFVTARTNKDGRPILARMPALDDPSFWPIYAGFMKGRAGTPRNVLMIPAFVDLYLESPKFWKLAAATRKAYTIYLRRFAEELAPAPASDITRADILQVTDKMTPGAANLFVGCVGALYRWGRQRDHVNNDPCRDIEKNEVGEHEPWPDKILEAALASDDDIVRLAVHLLYYTAQRISDVVKMRWSDVGLEKMRVTQ